MGGVFCLCELGDDCLSVVVGFCGKGVVHEERGVFACKPGVLLLVFVVSGYVFGNARSKVWAVRGIGVLLAIFILGGMLYLSGAIV